MIQVYVKIKLKQNKTKSLSEGIAYYINQIRKETETSKNKIGRNLDQTIKNQTKGTKEQNGTLYKET